MPIKKIIDHVYGFEIHFILDIDKNKSKKYLAALGYNVRGHDSKYSTKNGFAYCDLENGVAFIVIPSRKTSHNIYTVIAHECWHITSRVLRSVGVKLSDSSEEAFTYYHSWIMEQLTDIYNAHYKTKRKKDG